MTTVGARMVAELLTAETLPLKKLVIHGNSIGAEGYAALGAAIRSEHCRLEEFVVSTQIKEKKTGQNRISKTEEHNVVVVAEVQPLEPRCAEARVSGARRLAQRAERGAPEIGFRMIHRPARDEARAAPLAHCACSLAASHRTQ